MHLDRYNVNSISTIMFVLVKIFTVRLVQYMGLTKVIRTFLLQCREENNKIDQFIFYLYISFLRKKNNKIIPSLLYFISREGKDKSTYFIVCEKIFSS